VCVCVCVCVFSVIRAALSRRTSIDAGHIRRRRQWRLQFRRLQFMRLRFLRNMWGIQTMWIVQLHRLCRCTQVHERAGDKRKKTLRKCFFFIFKFCLHFYFFGFGKAGVSTTTQWSNGLLKQPPTLFNQTSTAGTHGFSNKYKLSILLTHTV